jgi:hypothetical protein
MDTNPNPAVSAKLINQLSENEFSSNTQFKIVRKRRDAFRLMKIHESNGHEFIAKFFSQFTFCSFCDDFLWFLFVFIEKNDFITIFKYIFFIF